MLGFLVISAFGVVSVLIEISPIYPDINTGHIIPFDDHGRTVYLTFSENIICKGSLPVFFVFMGIAFFIEYKVKLLQRREPQSKYFV